MGSFSYTSHDTSILSGEFLLHISCLLHFYLGSFSYTSRAGFNFISWLSLTHLMLVSFFLLYIPCWLHFYLGIFFYIPLWLHFYAGSFSYTSQADRFYVGSFSYTSRAAFIFMRWVFLTHPVLPWFLCREFLLHISSWLLFLFSFLFYLGSFSYRSRGSFSYTCCDGLMFSWGGFVTHPKRFSFICGEFLLHTLYWLLYMQGVVLHIGCWRFF